MPADSDDSSGLTRPVDRMTPNAFIDVIDAYAEEDRITGGVCRLELEDGTERRLVVDEDLPNLDDDAYARRQIEELVGLFEESEDFEDRTVELTIPVGDVDRVVAEAKELGSVTTFFDVDGIRSLLVQLLDELETESDEQPVTPPTEAHGHGSGDGHGAEGAGHSDEGDDDDRHSDTGSYGADEGRTDQ